VFELTGVANFLAQCSNNDSHNSVLVLLSRQSRCKSSPG